MTVTAKQLFEKAIEIGEEKGWAQRFPADRGTAMCLGMLLDAAADALDLRRDVLIPVREQVVRAGNMPASTSLNDPLGAIIAWNDELGRTWTQVKDVLRRAADGATT